MGWLLTEVAPAQLWSALTGALWLDGYNLVLYLTLLGAAVSDLAWLPLVNYAGIALHVLIVALWPPRGDAKRTCIIYTFIARSLWLGTLGWPLFAWWLGLGTGAVLGGVFVAIFLTAMVGNVGVAAFMTYTAAVVPHDQRGRFFMWRNLGAFGLVTVSLQLVAWAWPVAPVGVANGTSAVAAADPAVLPWLMWLMAGATILVILSTFPLAWSPVMPARAVDALAHPPLRTALAGRSDFTRLVAMGGLNTAAMACVLPFLPRLLQNLGLDGKHYALLQGNVQVPLMLAGVVIAGLALRRLGGTTLMVFTAVAGLAGDAFMLLLTPTNLGWLTAIGIGLAGLGRGLASIGWIGRLQELAPAHDTRFPMLHIAANGLAGMLAGGVLMATVPWLEAQHVAGTLSYDPLWLVVAAGVGLRAGVLVLAVWPRRR